MDANNSYMVCDGCQIKWVKIPKGKHSVNYVEKFLVDPSVTPNYKDVLIWLRENVLNSHLH